VSLFLKTKLQVPEAIPHPSESLQQPSDIKNHSIELRKIPSKAFYLSKRVLSFQTALSDGTNLLNSVNALSPCNPNYPEQSQFTDYIDLRNNGWDSKPDTLPPAPVIFYRPAFTGLELSTDPSRYITRIDSHIYSSTNSEGVTIEVRII